MSGDPFATLARSQRLRGHLVRLRQTLLRPLYRDRIRPERPGPPNLLLVGIDTLRADHVGCYGAAVPTTPHLDRLAGGGTIFTDVTAPAPWTLPSFAGALTGLMPGLHGAYLGATVRNMDRQPPRHLEPGVVTLASHLRGCGYRTAAFYSNQFFAFGLAETFDHHAYHNLAAEDLAAIARDWMRRHGDQPFFCFVLFNDPHEPTTPRPRDLAPFLPASRDQDIARLARWGEPPLPHLGQAEDSPELAAALTLKLAVYAATVHEVDRALGGLQDQLETWDLARRTVVSVFADHGEEFREHAAEARHWNHDPRELAGIGHGHTHFQELLHVPWLTWGPGIPATRRDTRPVSLCDLAPTLADWLGVAPMPLGAAGGGAAAIRPDLPLQGRSLAEAPDGEPDARLILAEALAYGPDLVALRRENLKLIARRDGQPLGLYDLQADPGEKVDLQHERPEELAALMAELARWRDSGLGATGDRGGDWQDLDDTVRQRLRDLGYSE